MKYLCRVSHPRFHSHDGSRHPGGGGYSLTRKRQEPALLVLRAPRALWPSEECGGDLTDLLESRSEPVALAYVLEVRQLKAACRGSRMRGQDTGFAEAARAGEFMMFIVLDGVRSRCGRRT